MAPNQTGVKWIINAVKESKELLLNTKVEITKEFKVPKIIMDA